MSEYLHAFMLFGTSFALVFLLGLQSLLHNNHKVVLTFFCSLAIGCAQLFMYKSVPQAGGIEALGFLLGGPFGIVTSGFVFRKFFKKKEH